MRCSINTQCEICRERESLGEGTLYLACECKGERERVYVRVRMGPNFLSK